MKTIHRKNATRGDVLSMVTPTQNTWNTLYSGFKVINERPEELGIDEFIETEDIKLSKTQHQDNDQSRQHYMTH